MKKHSYFILLLLFVLSYGTNAQSGEFLNQSNHVCFIQNKGQWDKNILYLAKSNGMNAWITKNGIVYDYYKINHIKDSAAMLTKPEDIFKLGKKPPTIQSTVKGHVIKMIFDNVSENIQVMPKGKYETVYNYFMSKDSTKWASNVELNKEITISSIYPGISVRYYWEADSAGRQCLRYDYIAAPNADISQIKMSFKGQDGLCINDNGELVLKTSLGEVVHQKLYAYEKATGKTSGIESNAVNCRFIKNPDSSISFDVKNHDRSKTLVIDPLVWSTYLGGSNTDCFTRIKALDDGTVVAGGYSFSSDYPVTPGAYSNIKQSSSLIISKLNKNGTNLLCSTVIGTGNSPQCFLTALTVDSDYNIYISGATMSTTYPTTSNSYQPTNNGTYDAFITKFNSQCSSIIYSTYIGGSSPDFSMDIKVDKHSNTYIYGYINSSEGSGGYPTTPEAYDTVSNSTFTIFVTKLNSTGSDLVYSTFIGHNSNDVMPIQMALDHDNNAILGGYTGSPSFPTTPGTIQPTIKGFNFFITKLNQNGSNLIFSTFLGSDSTDCLSSLAIDKNDNIYILGTTNSTKQFPLAGNSNHEFKKSVPSSTDLVLCKINSDATKLLYSGYVCEYNSCIIGLNYYAARLAVNDNKVIVAFSTPIDNLYTSTTAIQIDKHANDDNYYAAFDCTSPMPFWATYLGGNSNDSFYDVDVDHTNNIVVAGSTSSTDFPTTPGCFDNTYNGGDYDGFISKISYMDCNMVTANVDAVKLGTTYCANDTTVIIKITNHAASTANITGTYLFNKQFTKFTLGNGGTFSLAPNETRQLTINIKPDAEGVLNDTLYIYVSNGCDNTIKIPITGFLYKYSFTTDIKDTLDFETICSLSDKYTSFTLTNTSNTISKLTHSTLLSPFSISDSDPLTSFFNIDESKKINIKFHATSAGTFYQNFDIMDTCGNTKRIVLKARAESPSIDLGPDVSICANDTVTIGATPLNGTAPYTFKWSPATGIDSPNSAITKAFPDTTTTYQLVAIDKSGCTFSDKITVNVFKNTQTKIQGDINVCAENEYWYYAVPENAENHWKVSGAKSADSTDSNILKVVWNDNTKGKIKLVQKFSKLCSDTAELNVNILSNIALELKDTTACLNTPCTIIPKITGKTEDISQIIWVPQTYLNNVNILNPVFQPAVPGSYKYYLTITNKNGCAVTDSININVQDAVKIASDRSSIDFGYLDACISIKDDSLKITNNSSFNVTITQYDINSDFNIVSPAAPFTLKSSETKTIIVRFNSNHSGQSQYNIVLHGSPCDWNKSISCTGNKDASFLTFEPNIINFGSDLSCLDIQKDTSIIIKNTSKSTIKVAISNAVIPSPYYITYPNTDKILNTNDTIQLNIRYKPITKGIFNTELLIPFESYECKDSIRIALNAEYTYPVVITNKEIKFPTIAGCDTYKDTIITITNSGSKAVVLDEIEPNNIFSTQQTGLSLLAGESKEIQIRFQPDNGDKYNDFMILEFSPCNVKDSIHVEGEKNGISYSTIDTLGFGTVANGTSTTKTFKFRNTGNIAIEIQAPENISLPFSLTGTSPSLPCTLNPGEELNYEISYSPNGGNFDTLLINQIISKPCNLAIPLLLIGNSENNNGKAEVYIKSGKAKTNEKINLPLMLKTSNNLVNSNKGLNFTAKLSFNTTLLIPDFVFSNDYTSSGIRSVTISGTALKDTGLLKDLQFTACLGNSICTDLVIDTVIWESSNNIKTTTENGTFCISNICPEGGVRLINPNASIGISKISPNPAENTLEIEFSLAESARTEICIYNILGTKVKTLLDQNITDYNLSTIKADVSDLSSEQYIIILKTPTFVQSAQIMVIK